MARSQILEGPGCGDKLDDKAADGVTCGEVTAALAEPLSKLAKLNEILADCPDNRELNPRQILLVLELFPEFRIRRRRGK